MPHFAQLTQGCFALKVRICLLFVLSCSSITACKRTPPTLLGGSGMPVRFRLPEGFHGMFLIQESQKTAGLSQVTDGHIVIDVPATGIVQVRGVNFLRIWHAESAAFQNGREIELIHHHPTSGDPDDWYFAGISGGGNDRYWFIVGRWNEVNCLVNRSGPDDDFKPGRVPGFARDGCNATSQSIK